jgi:hypothetical protein
VDARPRPRRVERRLVVVDRLRPEHADDAVMHGDERDGQQVGDPVLAEGEEREHDEEVKVELDVAAREMHEDRGRAHQAEAHERGLQRAARRSPARQDSEQRHHERLADDVQRALIVEQRPEGKLPVLSEHRSGQGDDHDVEEREPDQKAMPRTPYRLGQGAAGRDQGPEAA